MRAIAASISALMLATTTAGCVQPEDRPGIQQVPALAGEQFNLYSPETGTRYHIFVRLPQGYAGATTMRYPVVYLLDGDSAFPLLAAQHLFMTIDDKTPEAILVGIGYGGFDAKVNRRERDFVEGWNAFHSFLKQRVLPSVEARVRADRNRRILFGQSRGGRFVLRSAFADPDLFWGRIASNPSVEENGDLFVGRLGSHKQDNGLMVLVSGTKDTPANVAAFNRWQPAEFAMLTVKLPVLDGTHSADLARNYREGMNFILAQSGSANIIRLPSN